VVKERGLEGFVIEGKQTGPVDGLRLGIVGGILSFVFVFSCHENRLVMHSERAVSVSVLVNNPNLKRRGLSVSSRSNCEAQ